jgi:stearoyl-CoA desaturase (Delta-9 desaturase)
MKSKTKPPFRNFVVMKSLFCFVFPMLALKYGFGEDWFVAFYANIVKYVMTLNGTWAINSFAHTYGNHPYDK